MRNMDMQLEAAVVSADEPMTELLEASTCGICHKLFQEPKVLPCCHTYCKGCLDDLLEKPAKKSKIICPKCRKEHSVPENGPEGFLTDFSADEDVEFLIAKKIAGGSAVSTCHSCSKNTPSLVEYCAECTGMVCESCMQVHKQLKIFATHNAVVLEDLKRGSFCTSRKRLHLCAEHPENVIQLRCESCHQFICNDCIRKHRSHDLRSLKDTDEQVMDKLKTLKELAEYQLVRLKQDQTYMSRIKAELKTYPDKLKSNINITFDSHIQSLEERRQQLLVLKQVDARHREIIQSAKAQGDNIEEAIAGLESGIRFTERSLRNKTAVERIRTNVQATIHLQQATKATWDKKEIKQPLVYVGNSDASLKNWGDIRELTSADIKMKPLQKPMVGVLSKVAIELYAQIPPPTELSFIILYGKSSKRFRHTEMKVTKINSNKLTLEFTPCCSSDHCIVAVVGSIYLQADVDDSNIITVSGLPKMGTRVRRGPDWKHGDTDGGKDKTGEIINMQTGWKSCTCDVKWSNGTVGSYSWGEDEKYEIELAI